MRVGHTKKTNSIKIAIFNVPAVMFLSDGDEQFLDAVLELFTPEPGTVLFLLLDTTTQLFCSKESKKRKRILFRFYLRRWMARNI